MWPGMRPATGWIAYFTSIRRASRAGRRAPAPRAAPGPPPGRSRARSRRAARRRAAPPRPRRRSSAPAPPDASGRSRPAAPPPPPNAPKRTLRQRPVHGLAHELRQQRARGADQRAGDDQRSLRSTKPVAAAARPVNELSSEITTGMSAPPIGSTRARRAAARARRRQRTAPRRRRADARGEEHDGQRDRAR